MVFALRSPIRNGWRLVSDCLKQEMQRIGDRHLFSLLCRDLLGNEHHRETNGKEMRETIPQQASRP